MPLPLQVGASYLIVDLGEPGNRTLFWEYSCTGVEKMYTCNRSGKAIIEIIWKDNNFMNDDRYLELLAEKYPTEQAVSREIINLDGNIKPAKRNKNIL